MNNFGEFVSLWKSETKDIEIKEPNFLFLVVYPDKLKWDFGIEKQTQTTTYMVSGGFTGSGSGHDVQFCYRSQVNDFLSDSTHTHAMIVSVGMVFDMVTKSTPTDKKWRDNFSEMGRKATPNQVTSITDFYDFVESDQFCKAHIMARPKHKAYFHHQHINLNLTVWKDIGAPDMSDRYDVVKRSPDNYHDDYTPPWIELEGMPTVTNFTNAERSRKSFSYYRDHQTESWKDLDNVDMNDYYFSRFMTRISPAFYLFNTETFKSAPKEKFDILFSPTAGYSAELLVDKLNFKGEVILYDYTQDNIDIKKTVVDMNMSLDELYIYRDIQHKKNMVDNIWNKPATYRIGSMGTHEELRVLQERMRDEQEVEYWLMNLIEPDYSKLVNKIRGRNIFFDASNIFSYHISHAYYTLEDLIFSYERLHEILSYAETCWFQGTRPTKQWVREWL